MKRSLTAFLVIAFLASTAAMAGGRPDKSWKKWFGHVSTGYVSVTGDAGDIADDGWGLAGGATWWPEGSIGLRLEGGFYNFDLASSIVESFKADDGEVDILAVTAAAVWSPNRGDGKVGFYLSGGLGGYEVEGQVTEPGLVRGVICDPWLWWCEEVITTGDVITESASTTKLGYNAGLGLTFELDSGSQVFLEATYHRIETKQATEFIPFVIGFRW